MSQIILTRLYSCDHPIVPDDYDKGMVDAYLKNWNSFLHNDQMFPRVGDFIIMPDGSYERAAYLWPDGVQTCTVGSFYLGNGCASMSGGLHPTIPNEKIAPTGEVKEGDFWTFHHDQHEAHNAIGIKCSCRVFKVIL